MSYRNSFCTEYIYDKEDQEIVFNKLCQNYNTYCNLGIISGLIKNTWCSSTPYDLQEILNGVETKHPITFTTISENGNYANVHTCILENGLFTILDENSYK